MNYTLVICSIAIHLISIYLFLTRRIKLSLLLLFVADIVLRYWFAHLDPFLNDWDEMFHALVAKNLTHHWLTPTLTDHPFLSYDHTSWWTNHIWLHKQPVFLWQIAASIKLFGANIFAVRLPSIILGSLIVFVLFDIAKNCFSVEVGFIAAFLYSFFEPILEMNSGFSGMDHNTIAFIFYTTLSIWAWIRFEKNPTFKWIILMGVFSGLAVLNKWLTGMLVFGGFGFYHLFMSKDFFKKDTLTFLLAGIAACFLTFLPWQIYTFIHFPMEAGFEFDYNNLHFYQVVEQHAGEKWFYFHFLKFHYKALQPLILIGFVFTLWEYRRNALAVSLMVMCLITYSFFTLAATKMNEYVLLVAPLMLVFMALAIVRISNILFGSYTDYRIPALLLTFIGSYFFFDLNNIKTIHDPAPDSWAWNYRQHKKARVKIIENMKPYLQKNDVIINCPDQFYIDIMFYTDHTAYPGLEPSEREELISRGKNLIPFPDVH